MNQVEKSYMPLGGITEVQIANIRYLNEPVIARNGIVDSLNLDPVNLTAFRPMGHNAQISGRQQRNIITLSATFSVPDNAAFRSLVHTWRRTRNLLILQLAGGRSIIIGNYQHGARISISTQQEHIRPDTINLQATWQSFDMPHTFLGNFETVPENAILDTYEDPILDSYGDFILDTY